MKSSPKEYSGVKEIARRANVSIATVDRVIHNRTGVSAKTRDKINKIIAELAYQPNLLASRLASRKILNLAVLIPDVSEETDFWEAPLRGIQRAEAEIRQYGVQVNIHLFDLNDTASFAAQAKKILASGPDAILLSPSFVEESRQFARDCEQKEIPFILIDSNLPEAASLSYIGPPLAQSGTVAAKLLMYRQKKEGTILVVNLSREIDPYNYLQIEEGFRSYFREEGLSHSIIRLDIRDTSYLSVAKSLKKVVHSREAVDGIFVTNSRVFSVARFLEENDLAGIPLIGYDFLKQNIDHLKNGTIDFLICHKPEEQGYRSVMALYQSLVLGTAVGKVHFMPIDIVTKENCDYY